VKKSRPESDKYGVARINMKRESLSIEVECSVRQNRDACRIIERISAFNLPAVDELNISPIMAVYEKANPPKDGDAKSPA